MYQVVSLHSVLLAYVNIGKRQLDDAIKSARPSEGRVQSCRPVGGGHDHHTSVVLKPIHLCQQLVDGVY